MCPLKFKEIILIKNDLHIVPLKVCSFVCFQFGIQVMNGCMSTNLVPNWNKLMYVCMSGYQTY